MYPNKEQKNKPEDPPRAVSITVTVSNLDPFEKVNVEIQISNSQKLNMYKSQWDDAQEIFLDFGNGIFILHQKANTNDPNAAVNDPNGIGEPSFTYDDPSFPDSSLINTVTYCYKTSEPTEILAYVTPGIQVGRIFLRDKAAFNINYQYIDKTTG